MIEQLLTSISSSLLIDRYAVTENNAYVYLKNGEEYVISGQFFISDPQININLPSEMYQNFLDTLDRKNNPDLSPYDRYVKYLKSSNKQNLRYITPLSISNICKSYDKATIDSLISKLVDEGLLKIKYEIIYLNDESWDIDEYDYKDLMNGLDKYYHPETGELISNAKDFVGIYYTAGDSL